MAHTTFILWAVNLKDNAVEIRTSRPRKKLCEHASRYSRHLSYGSPADDGITVATGEVFHHDTQTFLLKGVLLRNKKCVYSRKVDLAAAKVMHEMHVSEDDMEECGVISAKEYA